MSTNAYYNNRKGRRHSRRKIEAADLNNEAAIEQAFNDLMDFDGWHSSNLDEWIDLVSQSEKMMSASAHFKSEVDQTFQLEIMDVNLLLKRPWLLAKLIAKVEHVNTHYILKVGKPILALELIPTEEQVHAAAVAKQESGIGLEIDSSDSGGTGASEQIYLPLVNR